VIVTSLQFVERGKLEQSVAGLQDEGLELRYLEDIAKEISFPAKIAARFRAISARSIHRRERVDPDEAAVILFTSGSEGEPKGVVLSHGNLLSNCRQVLAMLDANPADRVFNALPLFHAFGLTGGLLMPLVLGARSYLYPSPLHSKIVAELVYDSQATIFFATDTFLANYARVAHPYDFHAIRHIFAGAEKLREETRRTFADRFGKRILEGYGATECSPVIALNTPMHNKAGSVGRFVPALDWRLATVEGVSEGGRLQVKGPNVMLGYLRASKPGQLEAPEEGWYDSGDIVQVDESGYVTILGRAKRFAKIAGEMVSLAALETALAEARPEAGHAVVSLPDPRKGEALALFTTDATLDRAAVAAILKDAGLPELAQPRRIETME
ncbi:MAG: AMP-binding protein, partial [Burkholderiales bacterium]